MNIDNILPATFSSRIDGVECALELHLNHDQCLRGLLRIYDEFLEVRGGIPNAFDEVRGLLRTVGSDQSVAVFRANFLGLSLLEFEVEQPGAHDLMALIHAERHVFRRITGPRLRGESLSGPAASSR
jgi:hypothetical protein